MGAALMVASAGKFLRNFELVMQINEAGDVVAARFPLTIEFDIVQNTLMSANSAHIVVYNLARETRGAVFHDYWQTNVYRRVLLKAGYNSDIASPFLPRIFQGNAQKIQNYRRGADWVTVIDAFDGGFGMQNGQHSLALPSGYTLQELIRSLIDTMPHVTAGAIGDFKSSTPRGVSSFGNSWEQVTQVAKGLGGEAFIYNEKVHVMKKEDHVAAASVFEVSSATGLLDTPTRESEYSISLDMLFEPRIQLDALVSVNSQQPANNGLWIVKGVSHRGRISASMDGGVTTRLNLYNPWLDRSRAVASDLAAVA